MTTFFNAALAVAALAIPLLCAYLIVRRLARRGRRDERAPAGEAGCDRCAGAASRK
jgi:hypothetical protein